MNGTRIFNTIGIAGGCSQQWAVRKSDVRNSVLFIFSIVAWEMDYSGHLEYIVYTQETKLLNRYYHGVDPCPISKAEAKQQRVFSSI